MPIQCTVLEECVAMLSTKKWHEAFVCTRPQMEHSIEEVVDACLYRHPDHAVDVFFGVGDERENWHHEHADAEAVAFQCSCRFPALCDGGSVRLDSLSQRVIRCCDGEGDVAECRVAYFSENIHIAQHERRLCEDSDRRLVFEKHLQALSRELMLSLDWLVRIGDVSKADNLVLPRWA